MAFAPIPEYEGKSPYVFITYAQQDEKIAYSIAVKMFNEGFRLWSSAACGNPSNMRIAERLSNSSVAMVFLSKSYLKYASYNEFEPRVVMSSPKQKIVICLDDTPLGTDWNTVDFPAGIRYNPEFPQELWLRINSSDALEKCRGAWPSRKMPLPFDDIPTVNISVDSMDEDELSGELNSLNSVMSSFGAGLDDDDIKNITLFQKKSDDNGKWQEWKDRNEPSQEQEYYAIENLIDSTPMPAEQKQYNSMIGLIENFMEKSNRLKENQLKDRISAQAESAPSLDVPTEDFVPLPLSEFDRMDMSGDTSDTPVVFTDNATPYQPADSLGNDGFTPITIDYGDSYDSSLNSEQEGYTMTRNSARSERLGSNMGYADDDKLPSDNLFAPPVLETIADDRVFLTSTQENVKDARLTYHLGTLDGFDERDYIQPEPPQMPPVAPVRFTENDEIGLPALSFARPEPSLEVPAEGTDTDKTRKVSVKYRKRWRVAVKTRINRIEYEDLMYKVNDRWIPGEIYHAKMPNAKYTEVRRMLDRTTEQAVVPSKMPSDKSRITSDSRLVGAVNSFRSPKNTVEIPKNIRTTLRQKHEMRQAAAIRQLELEQAITATSSAKALATSEEEEAPARKHKFSHEAGIKKSLMLPMESPVDMDTEESHRQYGARAQITTMYPNNNFELSNNKNKKDDSDEDALIAIPTYSGQPKINYDPSAYNDMNLSEILFSTSLSSDGGKQSKKNKKK